jgi:sulfur-oxidizing protein SoxZ
MNTGDQPIRIRARVRERDGRSVTEAQVLMPHPMETGMRQDTAGALVPAHHITDVTVTLGPRTVFAARMSIAVARDPLLHFRFTGAEPGQVLRVVWVDTQGRTRSDEAVIT